MNGVRLGLLASLALGSLALVLGCSQLTSTGGGGESYFPHEAGYSWTYSSSDGTSSIVTVEGTTAINSAITAQIFRNTILSTVEADNAVVDSYYVVNSSGVYYYGYQHSQHGTWTTTEAQTLLSFPLQVGRSWTYYQAGYLTAIGSVALRETVTVPAGSFECYKVVLSMRMGSLEQPVLIAWLGDGVGLVKTVTSNPTVETELVSKSF